MAILGVKIKPIWRAGSRVWIRPGECFMSHITIQCIGTTLFRPIFALSRYLFRAGRVQNMAIFGVKHWPLWRAGSRLGSPSGNRFLCHITLQYMETHD